MVGNGGLQDFPNGTFIDQLTSTGLAQCGVSTTNADNTVTNTIVTVQPSMLCPTAGAGQTVNRIGTPIAAFRDFYFGDTWKPRVSVGFGVNWRSPFGPFRIDIAKALLKEPGDDTKLITFNVGTQF